MVKLGVPDVCRACPNGAVGQCDIVKEGTTWTKPNYLGCSRSSRSSWRTRSRSSAKNNLARSISPPPSTSWTRSATCSRRSSPRPARSCASARAFWTTPRSEANRMIPGCPQPGHHHRLRAGDRAHLRQQQADTILADARELERQTRAGAEDYAKPRGVRAHRAEPRHAAEQHAPLRSPERRPLSCVAPVNKQVTRGAPSVARLLLEVNATST